MEGWNNGIMEGWEDKETSNRRFPETFSFPVFTQSSSIPSFQ
jgi:hypothetical protein